MSRNKLFILGNNDEKEVEASIEMGEEELVNLKEREKDVEILHKIDPDRCEIYIHALIGLLAPQTLKVAIYIKKTNVIVIFYYGSTHNFINKGLTKCLNLFVYLLTNFQVLVAMMWEKCPLSMARVTANKNSKLDLSPFGIGCWNIGCCH
jgi:hypothetical protein